MTAVEAYDLACKTMKSPAVVMMGDQCVIGEWVKLSEYNATLCLFVSKSQGVKVRGQGKTWTEAATKARLFTTTKDTPVTPVTNTRMATVKDVTLARKEKKP